MCGAGKMEESMFFFYLLCHKLLSLRLDFQESFPLKLQWPSALSSKGGKVHFDCIHVP